MLDLAEMVHQNEQFSQNYVIIIIVVINTVVTAKSKLLTYSSELYNVFSTVS